MTVRYSHQQLLRLRDSPLVCKPARLPPPEEWMGPTQDPNLSQRNGLRTSFRGKAEENGGHGGISSKRPPFESRVKSSTAPEDIVLGPPKTAFASATGTRAQGKQVDLSQRPSIASHDEMYKDDRSNLRERHSREGQRLEKGVETLRDGRAGAVTTRRNAREASDSWSNTKSTKEMGRLDDERASKRDKSNSYERDKEGSKESRKELENSRDNDRDLDRGYDPSRTGPVRDRHKPRGCGVDQVEESSLEVQPTSKSHDWQDKERRDNRGFGRELYRNNRIENEPEWMGALEPEEGKDTRTADDFEKFMQSMRSGKWNAHDSNVSTEKIALGHERTISGTAKSKLESPLVVDSSFDGFFGLYKETKDSSDLPTAGGPTQSSATPVKPSRGSKFTALFGAKPQPEVSKDPPEQSPVQNIDSANADKEGFQRILNLLDQQQNQTSKAATPPRQNLDEPNRHAPAAQPPPHRTDCDPPILSGLKSSPAKAGPSGDHLWNLMRPSQQSGNESQKESIYDRQMDLNMPPGLQQFSNLAVSSPENIRSSRGLPPYFFDNARDEEPGKDKLNSISNAERRPPPGLYDGNYLPRHAPNTAPSSMAYPLGVQRPMGLEQHHFPMQRQGMAPPPGFALPTRGQSNAPPGLGSSNISDRSAIGMPANGRGMPPPGFMNGPPPGVSPSFHSEGFPYGGFGEVGGFGQNYLSGHQRR